MCMSLIGKLNAAKFTLLLYRSSWTEPKETAFSISPSPASSLMNLKIKQTYGFNHGLSIPGRAAERTL